MFIRKELFMKKIIIFLDRLFKTNLITKVSANFKGADLGKPANPSPESIARIKKRKT